MRFPCSQCDYKATTNHSLKLHTTSQHLNEKAQCSYCGKQIAKSYLKRHIQGHKQSQIHRCDQCTYETTRPDCLKTHIEVKHGSIVHKCKDCDYKSSYRSHFKEHIKKKHALSGNT